MRPADVEVGGRAGPGTASGRVLLHQRLGRDEVLHVDVDGAVLRALVPAGADHPLGSSVHLRLPADRLFLFDGRTGRALGPEVVAACPG